MSAEIIFVFLLLLFALALFATEILSFDVVALIIACSLMVSGLLTVSEGLSGISNAATVTIGAMFVVSEGIRRTGVLEYLSRGFMALTRLGTSPALAAMMIIIAVVSAFINNTAAVVIFIPVIMEAAKALETSPSKLLMPLSFASMFGGVCTLVGTSTNILVSAIAEDHGLKGFSMFEFLPLGFALTVAGFVYLFTVGLRWIPARRKLESLTDSFEMSEYLTDIVLAESFPYLGSTLEELQEKWNLDVEIVRVFRRGREPETARCRTCLEKGDVLRIRGNPRELSKLLKDESIFIKASQAYKEKDPEPDRYALQEVVVAPDSELESRTLGEINFPERFGAVVLGMRHRGQLQKKHLDQVRLSGGDSLLLTLSFDQIPNLQNDPSFVVVTDVSPMRYRTERIPLALAILAGVIGTAAVGLLPIVVSALCGAVLMVLTGCVSSRQAYQAVNWKVIFLLAGVIPLGLAMEKTGAARLLSNSVLSLLGDLGPRAVLAGFFLLTMLLTGMISNQATAAVLAPIGIEVAREMGVDPYPLLMGITFAASLSFLTPMGYQTNTLVYGPGHYRFTDFTRVGSGLNLIFWALATALIPMIWPF